MQANELHYATDKILKHKPSYEGQRIVIAIPPEFFMRTDIKHEAIPKHQDMIYNRIEFVAKPSLFQGKEFLGWHLLV